MKKTLQKKLDKLGDRLKKNYKKVDFSDLGKTEHPLNVYLKGEKYDALKKEHEALKKQRDELLEFCKKLYKTLNEAQKRCGGNSSYGDIFTVYFAKGNNIGERLKQLINNK